MERVACVQHVGEVGKGNVGKFQTHWIPIRPSILPTAYPVAVGKQAIDRVCILRGETWVCVDIKILSDDGDGDGDSDGDSDGGGVLTFLMTCG